MKRSAWLAGVALMATACGTTVSPSALTSGRAPNAAASPDGALVAPGPFGQSAPGAIGGQLPTGASLPGQASGPAGTTSEGGQAAAGSGRGAGPVQLGIEYFDSSQAVQSGQAAGYTVSPGDPYSEAKALVAWVNQHGGLGGHRVEPVYFQFSTTGPEDTQEQSACQTWTQDHHAVAVIWPNNFSSSDLLPNCLSRAGVMLTGGADSYLNSPQLSALRGYLQTAYMFAGDRMYQRLIDRLVATHWFTPGGKIAVLSDDGATYAANVHTVDQTLARYGLTAVDHATLSTTSPGQDPADCQSAGLRFAADHVTNVVVVDDGARAFLYCSPIFRSQSYFPKFSITSYDSPSTVQTLIPASSLSGSAGIGWEPVNDVNPATLNNSGTLCVSIMRAAGLNITASAFTEAIAFAYCDAFFFLHRAYSTVPTLAAAGVQAAVAGLGTSYLSPITLRTRFEPGRYDGAAATADLQYQTSCRCYRYSGAASSVS